MVVRILNKTNGLPKELTSKLKGLTAARTVNYLNYSFGASEDELEMNGVSTTPTKILKDLPALQAVPASTVAPLSFWGGPPGKKDWYEGSLLTFLVDRILNSADAGNWGLLGRFFDLNV
jgi:hypothetical protein